MDISKLKPGETYIVKEITGAGAERQRLLDLGFVPGTPFVAFNIAPFGGTALLGLRGYMLALRQNACDLIKADKKR